MFVFKFMCNNLLVLVIQNSVVINASLYQADYFGYSCYVNLFLLLKPDRYTSTKFVKSKLLLTALSFNVYTIYICLYALIIAEVQSPSLLLYL